MSEAVLEHVNVTVRDPDATAKNLCAMFDWGVRWTGGSIHDGYSVHVGGEKSYIALYAPPKGPKAATDRENYFQANGLNHIAVVVEDLKAVETRVRAAGFTPGETHDYEPGKRFYFIDGDGVEYEVVEY